MTDEMESKGRRGLPGNLELRVRAAVQAEADRLARRARAVRQDPGVPRGPVVSMAWTDEMERWGRTGRLDPLVFPERSGPLARAVRRVSAARRVSRALKDLAVRLARRAQL